MRKIVCKSNSFYTKYLECSFVSVNKLLENAHIKVRDLVAVAPKGSLSAEEENAIRSEYAKQFLEYSQLEYD